MKRPTFVEVRTATRHDRLVAVVILLAVIAACGLLVRSHPSEVPFLPACPSKSILGVECPGCGSTRGLHHLLHGRLAETWRHNPALIVLGLPFAVLLLVDAVATLVARRRVSVPLGGRFGIVVAVALILYTVARNLPFAALDALRPPVTG